MGGVGGTNIASFLAGVLLLEGTREFFGKRSRYLRVHLLTAACAVLQVFFLVVVDSLNMRVVVASGFSSLLSFATAQTLIAGSSSGRRLGYWLTSTLFLVAGAINLLRAAAVALLWPSHQTHPAGGSLRVYGAPRRGCKCGSPGLTRSGYTRENTCKIVP